MNASHVKYYFQTLFLGILFLTGFPLFSQTGFLSSATLVGTVTNATTGHPVIGARITVNGISTYSVTAGVYSLSVQPLGVFAVNVSKAGFDPFTSDPITFQSGNIITLNITLWETPNPSPLLSAVMDTANQRVYLSWGQPEGIYELIYEDGLQDNFTVWSQAGNMNAVKFTPVGYPALVKGCKINIGNASNYPAGSNPLVPFQVIILDGNGMGGTPGNVIAGPFDVIPAALGWIDFTFPTPVSLAGGNFFIAMIQGGNAPNAAGLAIDITFPQYRSYFKATTGNNSWVPAAGNFMIRALVSGPGGPLELTSGEQNMIGYQLWRLHQGEELNPMAWVFLGSVNITETVDPSWPALPCGPHRWCVKAGYTGNRWSEPTFSNVLGKCWTAPVNINLSLSCATADPEGTLVTLRNQVYQDTVYQGVCNHSGQVVFPGVWKGSYEVKAMKFGYLTYSGFCSVNTPLSLDIILLQIKSPPTHLVVDSVSLHAVWDEPFYTIPLLQENFNSGDFLSGGWVREGGINWRISMTAGHPAPSAFFSWSPPVPDYEQSLTSRIIEGQNSPIMTLQYDINLDNYSTAALNQMAIEIYDGISWHTLKVWTNAGGSIPWTTDVIDISTYANAHFNIRFRAFGQDSYQINGWYVDNILITASESAHLLAPCIFGYNFYLDNTVLALVNDNHYTIDGSLVSYDSTYQACVRAIYTSGYSDQVCDALTSHFLWPPTELNAEILENTVYLSWHEPTMPSDSGPVMPEGVKGYDIYRNGSFLVYLPGNDNLSFYDVNLEPGNYSYTVAALYDLTAYGHPGHEDQSMPAGPVSVMIHYGRLLPFNEPWNQGSFTYNEWRFNGQQGNWAISQDVGNPPPSAIFSGLPEHSAYSFALESPVLDATPNNCAKIWMDFDLKLMDKSASGNEKLTAEVFYNNTWHQKAQFSNSGNIEWMTQHIDISVVKGRGFRLRFIASGDNSDNISTWLVDNIAVYAVCLPPTDPYGEAWGYDIHLSWSPPQCSGGGNILQEGFEGEEFPPPGWSQITHNAGASWTHTGIAPPIGVHSGNYSAGLYWDYNHQDEWLIAKNVYVGGNLSFWSLAYQGSAHDDHYYVKVSTDQGNSWDVLMDLSALPPFPGPGGYNQWQQPYMINMSSYLGDVVDLAWHATDNGGQGLWYYWGIDDCTLGGQKLEFTTSSLLYDVYRQNPSGGDYVKANSQPLTDTAFIDLRLPYGLYHYYILTTGNTCMEATASDTIEVDVITSLGKPYDEKISIYPNPARDQIRVKSTLPMNRILLINVLGLKVAEFSLNGVLETIIPIENLSKGHYLMKIFTLGNSGMHCIPMIKY